MKVKKILVFISLCFLFLTPDTAHAQDTRTEEYAVISVVQRGKKNFVSVTIGSTSTEEREFAKERNDKAYDMAPVIAEMEKLNAMGYELFDSNVSIVTSGQSGGFLPFYYFLFKKEL